MKILTDGFEILESGELYSPAIRDVTFVISEDPPMNIVFKLVFNEKQEPGIDLEKLDDHTLALVFSNPSTLGWGVAKPAKVGHLNGRELFVALHVDMKSGNQAFNLHYTFYLREVENA